jgi:exopolyphosphatase/pppGpp-phosphohydrolase
MVITLADSRESSAETDLAVDEVYQHITNIHAQPSHASVLLHIDSELTYVACGEHRLHLSIGSNITALGYFKHQPPNADEMEYAITKVENEIMAIRQHIPPRSQLFSSDEGLRVIAQLAGVIPQSCMTLSLEQVERTFDRLALVINGHPAKFEGIPDDNTFAARLLILREFMHHLQFDEISLLTEIP